MKTTISYDESGIKISFHDWKENRNRMSRIDLELVKALGVVSVVYEDILVIEKTFLNIHSKEYKENSVKKVFKVLAGFMIKPEVI